MLLRYFTGSAFRATFIFLAVAILLALPPVPDAHSSPPLPPSNLLSIKATNSPLSSVLDEACKKLAIACTSMQHLNEPVTIELLDMPPGKALQQLLSDWNTIFLYDQSSPAGLRKVLVLSRKKERPMAESTTPVTTDLAITVTPSEEKPKTGDLPSATLKAPRNPPQPTSDPYGAGVFVSPDRQALQELSAESFQKGLSVAPAPLVISTPPSPGASAPQKDGVRIAAINNDFFRTGLGLQDGDVVRDINGWPTEDPSQFISKITEAVRNGKSNIVRLEVERTEEAASPAGEQGVPSSNGQQRTVIQPIYIDLGEGGQ